MNECRAQRLVRESSTIVSFLATTAMAAATAPHHIPRIKTVYCDALRSKKLPRTNHDCRSVNKIIIISYDTKARVHSSHQLKLLNRRLHAHTHTLTFSAHTISINESKAYIRRQNNCTYCDELLIQHNLIGCHCQVPHQARCMCLTARQ